MEYAQTCWKRTRNVQSRFHKQLAAKSPMQHVGIWRARRDLNPRFGNESTLGSGQHHNSR